MERNIMILFAGIVGAVIGGLIFQRLPQLVLLDLPLLYILFLFTFNNRQFALTKQKSD